MDKKKQAPTGIGKIQAEIETLAARRTGLVERRTDAEARREAARQARISILKTGGQIDQHNTVMRAAADEMASIDELLAEIDTQAVEVEASLTAARDQEQRTALAAQLNAIGPAAIKAAKALDTAMAEVGAAYAALVTALPERLAIAKLDREAVGREAIVRALLAEAVATACPGAMLTVRASYDYRSSLPRAFPTDTAGWLTTGVDGFAAASAPGIGATAMASSVIGEGLKLRAASILDGTAPATLDDFGPVAVEPPPAPQPPAEPFEVIAREDFHLQITHDAAVEDVRQFEKRTLPADLALAAISLGVAYRAGSTEAVDLEVAMRTGSRVPNNAVGKFAVVRDDNGKVTTGQANTYRAPIKVSVAETAA